MVNGWRRCISVNRNELLIFFTKFTQSANFGEIRNGAGFGLVPDLKAASPTTVWYCFFLFTNMWLCEPHVCEQEWSVSACGRLNGLPGS